MISEPASETQSAAPAAKTYDDAAEKIAGEFREAGLRLHAAAVENEMLRSNLTASIQHVAVLEGRLTALQRERDEAVQELHECRRMHDEIRVQLESTQRDLTELLAKCAENDWHP